MNTFENKFETPNGVKINYIEYKDVPEKVSLPNT